MGKKFALLVICALLIASYFAINPAYAPSNDSWESKAPMQQARYGLGVAVINNKIFAIGGQTGNPDAGYSLLNINEEYDPKTNQWIFKASMPTPRTHFAIAAFQNNIYCIGGETNNGVTGVNEVYNPVKNTWETKTSLPNPRYGVEASVVDGQIYLIGGGSNITDVYDPATDSWTTKAPIPIIPSMDRGWSCALVAIDGKIHVIGASPFSNSHQIYNPSTNNWSISTQLVIGYWYADAVATTGENAPKRIYVFGSDSNYWTWNSPEFTTQNYDPKTDSWTVGTSIPSGRLDFGVAMINDAIYVIGGFTPEVGNSAIATPLTEQYIPAGYGTPDPSYIPSTEGNVPEITIKSPENKTYDFTEIQLNFTVNVPDTWLRYKLDGQVTVEIEGNATLNGLSYGSHNITIYATDGEGDTGVSETVHFNIAKETDAQEEPVCLTALTIIIGASTTIIGVCLLIYFRKTSKSTG